MAYSLHTPAPETEHRVMFAAVSADHWRNGPGDYIAFMAGCARVALGARRCVYECIQHPDRPEFYILTSRPAA